VYPNCSPTNKIISKDKVDEIALGKNVKDKGKDLSTYQKVNLELDYLGRDKLLRFYTRKFM
jgi:hypothetical protein